MNFILTIYFLHSLVKSPHIHFCKVIKVMDRLLLGDFKVFIHLEQLVVSYQKFLQALNHVNLYIINSSYYYQLIFISNSCSCFSGLIYLLSMIALPNGIFIIVSLAWLISLLTALLILLFS